ATGCDRERGREIRQDVRVRGIELESRNKRLNRTTHRRSCHWACRFEACGEDQVGIGIQADSCLRARYQNTTVGLAYLRLQLHRGRIEDTQQCLAPPQLVAFLGVAHGAVSPYI